MKSDLLPIPGIVLGAYPERRVLLAGRKMFGQMGRPRTFVSGFKRIRRYERFLQHVSSFDPNFVPLDTAAIPGRITKVRASMAREGMTDERLAEAFALIKRVCVRTLGVEVFPTQLIAARIMLDRRLAEMATGEGKTLAAGICAASAALAGIPVHVITANDYLVARDVECLRPLYHALGLTVGLVLQSDDEERRRRAYRCNVVYCTARELVFDYLRDGLARGGALSDLQRRVATLDTSSTPARGSLLQGLCMAIVDEADSILIDEARVPLILSERSRNEQESECLVSALSLAAQLNAQEDYAVHRQRMSAELTQQGRVVLERLAVDVGGLWRNRPHREETVCTALAALYLYQRDRHYLVRDGSVAIIDDSTGRLAPGRVWSRGLHQLIELKESCHTSSRTVTLAQITYQNFFQRYLLLCGMSGTLSEARGELRSTYGLEVTEVPLNGADRRHLLPTRIYPQRDAQWTSVVKEALEISRSGRPVLIGTDSVLESEELSTRLKAAALPHAVLNARQDGEEARIIAEAGQPSQVTVATNMAGRGTDILLGKGVAERGGLHIICCQHNASRRIDRQLLGRCARRGDPGSAQSLLALDKPLISSFVPRWLKRYLNKNGLQRPQWFVRSIVSIPQRLEERRQRAQRRELLRGDLHAEQRSSFGKAKE
ncbi:MAG: prepilin peptidase [Betaproteobacteria bacterium]|jgi:preprotein translocase subunit SecA|nr:prepilin peptidase [Betaproteobacteria bacterium]MEA3154344.1 preprotein translocase subunit SecA [Betaproteobacteria bacterium]